MCSSEWSRSDGPGSSPTASDPARGVPNAAIALGSNIEPRRQTLDRAIDDLDRLPGVRVRAVSPWLSTEPVGPGPRTNGIDASLGGTYLNGAALLETSHPPDVLLDHLLSVERRHGRDRSQEQRWGPRTLDLDLLLYADRVIDSARLTLPHPRLHERLFVLEPLAMVAPRWTVPPTGLWVIELRDRLRGSASAG